MSSCFSWADVSETRRAADQSLPIFDPILNQSGHFDSDRPGLPVTRFHLQARPEAFDSGDTRDPPNPRSVFGASMPPLLWVFPLNWCTNGSLDYARAEPDSWVLKYKQSRLHQLLVIKTPLEKLTASKVAPVPVKTSPEAVFLDRGGKPRVTRKVA